jgi:uncharacterized membrane protein
MNAPAWALSLAYWLHMLATVVWIGGLAALALLVAPVGRRFLNAQAHTAFFDGLQHRLDLAGWMSLAILTGTGMFQMSAHPNYEGFLGINNIWSMAILVKHLLFGLMIVISAYLSWGILPRLRRQALLQARSLGAPATRERLERANLRLLHLNLALGVIILALTALARVS